MRRMLICAALSLALVPGLAMAGDEDGEPRYSVAASIDNDAEEGAAFVLEGSAPNLPDGTLLHITLAIKGKYTSPVEAAFFQVRVVDQTFRARKVFPQQRFAPQLYWARVELFVGNQRSAIKNWIRRELGVGARAKLLLAKQDIEVGSLEEQDEFAQFALTRIRGFIVDYMGIRERASAVTADQIAGEAWEPIYTGFADDMSSLSKRFREFQKPYVVWNEQTILKKLGSAGGELSWAIRAFAKGQHARGQKVLEKTHGTLTRLLAEVNARLPAQDGAPPAAEGTPAPADDQPVSTDDAEPEGDDVPNFEND